MRTWEQNNDTKQTEHITECTYIGWSVSYMNNYTHLQATELLIFMWEKLDAR